MKHIRLISILIVVTSNLYFGCTQKPTSKAGTGSGEAKVSAETEKSAGGEKKIPNPLITLGKLDSAGNEIDNGKKKLYLTFDDGPNAGTRNVIDILNAQKVPATFYMIGLHRYGSPLQQALWKEVNTYPQFEITNHSFTHAYRNKFESFYKDLPGAVSDFVRNQDSLKFNNRIIRAPGSNVWRLQSTYIDPKFFLRTQVMDSLYKLGYYITGWDNEWSYIGKTQKAIETPDKLISAINYQFANPSKLNKPNHLVLLAHDMVYKDSTDAGWLTEFITKLKQDTAIEFRVISQYPGAAKAFTPSK